MLKAQLRHYPTASTIRSHAHVESTTRSRHYQLSEAHAECTTRSRHYQLSAAHAESTSRSRHCQ